jgi:hypothetical protein
MSLTMRRASRENCLICAASIFEVNKQLCGCKPFKIWLLTVFK